MLIDLQVTNCSYDRLKVIDFKNEKSLFPAGERKTRKTCERNKTETGEEAEKRQTDEETEGERRQCGEDLWVGPVCWLWAWSLCGPLLCNIHRSSGSHVSACGCNVHTRTHAHPYTHTNTVQTWSARIDCSLQRNPLTVQLPFCYVIGQLTSAPTFVSFPTSCCVFISVCLLSRLSTWPYVQTSHHKPQYGASNRQWI